MNHCRCSSYVYNTLIGIYSVSPPPVKPCTEYCTTVPDIDSLPLPEDCESLLVLVEDPNNPQLGGFYFDYSVGGWTYILKIISLVYIDPVTLKGIKGALLPDYEVLINGTPYTADQIFNGITFSPALTVPVNIQYRNIETG